MNTRNVCGTEAKITSNLIQHTILFSNNRQTIGNAGHGTNAFLIFCGTIEEFDKNETQVKIFNIKTKTSFWHVLEDICMEEDFGVLTEEEINQILADAERRHEN